MEELTLDKVEKQSGYRSSVIMFAICFLVYACAYIGRQNYSVAVNTMMEQGIVTTDIKGIISSAYFIAYAVGQIVNGILADKKSPFVLVGMGVSLIMLAEIAMFTIYTPSYLLIVWWAINGIGQSMLWAPIFFIINNILNTKIRFKAVTLISLTTPIGKITGYFLSGLSIKLGGWQGVFIMATIVMVILLTMWLSGSFILKKDLINPLKEKKIQAKLDPQAKKDSSFIKYFISSGVFIFIPVLMIHGLFSNGALEWIPTILQTQYSITKDVSGYLMMIVPAIGSLGVFFCNFVYAKLHNSEVKCAIFFFIISLVLTAVLFIMVKSGVFNVYTAIIFVAVFGIVYMSQLAVSHTMIAYMPMRFRSLGFVATMSGMLNAVTYGGTAISTYAMSFLTDNSSLLLIIWLIVLAVAIVFLLLGANKWKKFVGNNTSL